MYKLFLEIFFEDRNKNMRKNICVQCSLGSLCGWIRLMWKIRGGMNREVAGIFGRDMRG